MKFIPRFCILHPYQVPTVFISSDASYHALSAKVFKGGREQICFKFFSEYKIKQSPTWRELFAIQFALQSFAPEISNKSVCWETGNYTASLIVRSESYKTHWYLTLLGTQSHKTSKNIQKLRHSRGTFLALNFILAFLFYNPALQNN